MELRRDHRCGCWRTGDSAHQRFKTVRRITGKCLAVDGLHVEVDARLDFVIADADQLTILQRLAVAPAQTDTGINQLNAVGAVIG